MKLVAIIIGLMLAPSVAFAANGELHVTTENAGTISSVAPGSQRVPMLTLKLAATCTDDVRVRSITLYRRGLGKNSDIERLYLMSGNTRLTRGKSINNRNGKVQFTLPLNIAACASTTLTVMADMSKDANVSSEHRMVLRSAKDIQTEDAAVTATISTSFPRRRVSGPRKGSIDVQYIKLNRKVRFGRNQVVSRFRLEADNQHNHLVRSITFTNNGSARDEDLQNIVIQNGRRRAVTTSVEQLEDDRVTLYFTPHLFLRKNKRQLFRVQADPRGRAKRTIQLVIKEPSDIDAIILNSTRRRR